MADDTDPIAQLETLAGSITDAARRLRSSSIETSISALHAAVDEVRGLVHDARELVADLRTIEPPEPAPIGVGERWIHTDEAAELLGVEPFIVNGLARCGAIAGYPKRGQFMVHGPSLESFQKSRTRPGFVMDDPWLNCTEAAQYLGVDRRMVYELRKTGQLKEYTTARGEIGIPLSQLDIYRGTPR